jgi:tight adherence protein B
MSFAIPHWLLGLVVFVSALMVAYQFSGRILDWVRFHSIGTRDYIADKLKLMMIDLPLEKILLYQVAFSFGLGGLVFLACLPNIKAGGALGGVVAVAAWFLPKPIVNVLYQRRVDRFVEQMVDGLGLMSNGMRSGLSVAQAMGLVAQEMPDPIKSEFELLKETGGNLAETFDTITTLIRERIKVENKIKAMTASAFWQGMILLGVPPFMGLTLSQSDPELMRPMFETWLGWLGLSTVAILMIVAYFVIKKVTKIDV